MKRLLLQTCLMVGSVLILGIAANAQSQYRAEIPFDFQAAGAVYSAGRYSVGQITSGGPALIIRNSRTGKARLLGHANLGAPQWNGSRGKLIFLKTDGVYTLSEIATPSFAMKLKKTKTDVRMAGSSAPNVETVAINLH